MIYGESQRDPGQWTGIARIAVSKGHGHHSGTCRIGRSQDGHHPVVLTGSHETGDISLLFQVHGACRGSNKTLGFSVNDLGTGTFHACLKGGRGNAVTLAEAQHKLVLKIDHVKLLSGFELTRGCVLLEDWRRHWHRSCGREKGLPWPRTGRGSCCRW